ncbi:hypothetical protein LXL04_015680 [Taraxacum kok-saghyz]
MTNCTSSENWITISSRPIDSGSENSFESVLANFNLTGDFTLVTMDLVSPDVKWQAIFMATVAIEMHTSTRRQVFRTGVDRYRSDSYPILTRAGNWEDALGFIVHMWAKVRSSTPGWSTRKGYFPAGGLSSRPSTRREAPLWETEC